MIEVNLENQDRTRAIQDHQNLVQNHLIKERIISILTENEMQVQVVVPNQKKIKEQKIKTISKLERKKMEYRQRDHIEKRIKMTVAVTVIQVEKENLYLNEGVQHHEKIEVDLRIEIDREIDHVIDLGIDLGIDLEIGTEGK